ncbi:hypothetical protein BJ138DRAFT_1152521 [Hygrophoropsis aurantiaca]|uniref:Uncharacterized protein n=1 Tax=Hygrophoropsis aurantiaca TaxID=72124 RepID=A0ACB8ABD3_9AGAM|nr:hypothetical protein BJ138DRAFT_1152521 [Hygrophoropsis aurantiaca]
MIALKVATFILFLVLMFDGVASTCHTQSVAAGKWAASFYTATDCIQSPQAPFQNVPPTKLELGECVCKELSSNLWGRLESLVLSAKTQEPNELFWVNLYGASKKPCDSDSYLGIYHAGELVSSTLIYHGRSQVDTRYYKVCRDIPGGWYL